MLRCDYGTENCIMATAQIAFRLPHVDQLSGRKSFLYGPSTRNIVGTLIMIVVCIQVSLLIHTEN